MKEFTLENINLSDNIFLNSDATYKEKFTYIEKNIEKIRLNFFINSNSELVHYSKYYSEYNPINWIVCFKCPIIKRAVRYGFKPNYCVDELSEKVAGIIVKEKYHNALIRHAYKLLCINMG